MAHKEHKQFNETVFKQLCNKAREKLPKIVMDAKVDWETKHVAVLEHLLAKVRDFCGVEEGFKFEDLTGYPRSIQLKQEIIGIVDFDSVHEHPTSVFFYKQPIIEEYVRKAIGEESDYSGVHSHATSAKCPVLRSFLANTTASCQHQVASE